MAKQSVVRTFFSLSLIVIASMVLGACAPAAPKVGDGQAASPVAPTAVPDVQAVVATEAPAAEALPTGTLILQTAFTRGRHYAQIWNASGSQIETIPWMSMGLMYKDYTPSRPWLAKSITVDPSATKATVELHPEAQWHDGTPVTAEDLLFSWELYIGPFIADKTTNFRQFNIKGGEDFALGNADQLAGVTIISPTVLEVEFETPDSLWSRRNVLTFQIYPKHILDTGDRTALDQHPYMDAPVPGNGPYRFIRWEPDQYIEFARVDDWWGKEIYGVPYYDSVIFKHLTIENAVVQLEAGELDIARPIQTEAVRLSTLPNLQIFPLKTYGWGGIFGNPAKYDGKALEGLRFAIDQGAFVDTILAGYGGIATTYLVGTEAMNSPNLSAPTFDTDQALQLLTASGFDFDREYIYVLRNDNPTSMLRAQLFQGYLANIGIKVTFKPVATSALNETFDSEDWDFSDSGAPGTGEPLAAEACVNTLGWPRGFKGDWASLCDEMYATTDMQKQQELTWQLQETLWEKHPLIMLYESQSVVGVNTRVAGFEPIGPHGDLLKLRPAQ